MKKDVILSKKKFIEYFSLNHKIIDESKQKYFCARCFAGFEEMKLSCFTCKRRMIAEKDAVLKYIENKIEYLTLEIEKMELGV
jgi:DNA-directed RNA polymerase subunit RPC12/RpoP